MDYKYNLEHSYINNKKKLDILIVDDDTNSSELFKELLSLRGHNVSSLDEGVKCISKCMKNKYDIIFLDYHIGDIDGVELADCLKDVLKTESLIYAYTGDNNPNSIQKFKDVGMNGVFFKPINMNIINNFISTLETNKKINKQTNSVIYF
jgi:PleD family two-component response regulator